MKLISSDTNIWLDFNTISKLELPFKLPYTKNDYKLFGGTKMITENTRIKTLVDKGGYPAGTIGIVVSLYKSGSACEVEIWDETGYPIDVVTYLLSEIEENV